MRASPASRRPRKRPRRPAPKRSPRGKTLRKDPAFYDVLDAFHCFVVIEDERHVIRHMNARMKKRFGDLVGEPCHAALAGRAEPCPVCPVRLILHEGKESFTYVTKDRDGCLYECSASLLVMPDGERAVIQLLTDITEKRKAQEVINDYTMGLKALVAEKTEELKQSEILHRLLVEHAHDSIFTIDAERDRVLHANRMAEAITGYSAQELLSLRNTDLYAPGEFDRLTRLMGEAPGDGGASAQVEMITKSGRTIAVDVSASEASFRGRRVILAICRDVSQRLMIEKHMRQLASVIENMAASVILMDLQHRIIYVNPATLKMLGYREEEILGRSSLDLFEGVTGNPPDLAGKISREARNGLWEGEIFDRKKSGELFPISLRMGVIRNEKGEVIGYAGIAEDITRRKQLEEELIQKEKLSALGELVSGIAHELNNPLTGVLGYAEIIQQCGCPAEMREDIERLYAEASRCQHLVKNLLTFARRPAPRTQPADIAKILRVALDLKAYQFKADGIEMRLALDPVPEVLVDANQMQQVFINILNNARHALAERSGAHRITVASRVCDGRVEISIGNNGPHIPADRLEKIFTPFFSTKEFGQGTGLGLSIAQGIVKDHGGSLTVESLEDRDTVFTVSLPPASLREG